MIIKIEDLPKDRNIKSVSFDIEFEDGEVSNVMPQIDIEKSEARKIHEEMAKDVIDGQFSKKISEDMNDESNDVTVEKPQIPERKEHKAVPSEMTDMEF